MWEDNLWWEGELVGKYLVVLLNCGRNILREELLVGGTFRGRKILWGGGEYLEGGRKFWREDD